MATANIRLYVEHPLGQGQTVPLGRDQAHYLFAVMRLGVGDAVMLFNGRNGEWRSTVVEVGKRGGLLRANEPTGEQQMPPDLWLLFAPTKKVRTDFIVEKAAEMGARMICPVQTDFTNFDRIHQARLQDHLQAHLQDRAVEAAEQCGGTFVPEVCGLQKLDQVLDNWPEDRQLMFCDEALAGRASTLRGGLAKGAWAILIGPEDGFSKAERDRVQALAFSHAVSLGPRILRPDTAAVAAMTVWQQTLGDWQ